MSGCYVLIGMIVLFLALLFALYFGAAIGGRRGMWIGTLLLFGSALAIGRAYVVRNAPKSRQQIADEAWERKLQEERERRQGSQEGE